MFRAWVIYGSALIASLLFVFFHNKFVAYLIFCAILILPVLSLALFQFYKKKLNLTIRNKNTMAVKGSCIGLTVQAANHSILPVSRFTVQGEIHFATYDTMRKIKISGFLYGKGRSVLQYQVKPKFRGLIEYHVKQAVVYDYLGLFHCRIRINKNEMSVVVPKRVQMGIQHEKNILLGESDFFSKEKPGDDVSEVFQVREYHPGDRIKTIHWNLSARSKEWMVRDFSLPVVNTILIAADFSACCADPALNIAAADKMTEIVLSIVSELLEQDAHSMVTWYSASNNDMISLHIRNVFDFEYAMKTLSSEKIYAEGIPYAALLRTLSENAAEKNKIYSVCVSLDDQTQSVMQSIKSNGQADIDVYYIKTAKYARPVKRLRDSGIRVQEYFAGQAGQHNHFGRKPNKNAAAAGANAGKPRNGGAAQ